MANIEVKLRRGTEAEHDTTNGGFTGAEGEVTVDTTNNTLRVHDNSTAGGIRLAKHSEVGLSAIANFSVLGNVSGASAVPVAVDIKDEDAMTSDSATALATQQSIKAYVDSNAGIPTGTVSAFAGSTAPTGYVLCDGSEYSETTKAALFAVISTTYNTGGETANHFRVPDLRGRVVAGLGDNLIDVFAIVNGAVTSNANVVVDGNVGTIEVGMAVSGSGIGAGVTVQTVTDQNNIVLSSAVTLADNVRLTFTRTDVLGDTGGAKTHALTEAEMPSHHHKTDGTDSGNKHAVRKGSDAIIDGTSSTVSANDADYIAGSKTGTAGGGSAHNNVQPTIILNYIIKY